MKEKFTIIIETLHADDDGERENVSSREQTLLIVVFLFFFFCFPFTRASSMLIKIKHETLSHASLKIIVVKHNKNMDWW